MQTFRKVGTGYWQSIARHRLSPEATLLHLYLLTNSHSNAAGFYRVSLDYIHIDTRIPPKNILESLEMLDAASLVKYSEDEGVVLVEDWFAQNPVSSPNHAKHILQLIEDSEVPKDSAPGLFKIFAVHCAKALRPAMEKISELEDSGKAEDWHFKTKKLFGEIGLFAVKNQGKEE